MSTLGQAYRKPGPHSDKAARLVEQTGSRKTVGSQAKLYRDAPEVECIQGQESPYEFGVKVGLAMTLKGNLIVGAELYRQSLRRTHPGRARSSNRPS
ncbi:MAG: hypothetical protein U1E84_16495 [Rhodoferax sp.]